jgi:hypothetical protein
MKKLGMLTLAGLLAFAGAAAAQTKTITGDEVVVTATVEAIDAQNRILTLKSPDGTYEMVYAPPEMKRFAELKVGDKITARYYDNIVIRLKKPGEAAVDLDSASVTPGVGKRPGGTAATQRTITATIIGIDPKVPSISLTGPNGWKYISRVEDKKALSMLKVGDKLDITWTEALLISVDTAK